MRGEEKRLAKSGKSSFSRPGAGDGSFQSLEPATAWAEDLGRCRRRASSQVPLKEKAKVSTI